MPAIMVHDVDVSDGMLDADYTAMELLYYTDAYQYLIRTHFNARAINHPRTMRHLCQDRDGAHRRLVVLWSGFCLSAV